MPRSYCAGADARRGRCSDLRRRRRRWDNGANSEVGHSGAWDQSPASRKEEVKGQPQVTYVLRGILKSLFFHTHWRQLALPSLLTVRRTLKSGLTPEEALALGLTDGPDPWGCPRTNRVAVDTQLQLPAANYVFSCFCLLCLSDEAATLMFCFKATKPNSEQEERRHIDRLLFWNLYSWCCLCTKCKPDFIYLNNCLNPKGYFSSWGSSRILFIQ